MSIKFQINAQNYEACAQYLFTFRKEMYKSHRDVDETIMECLETLQRFPDSAYVEFNGLLLVRHEETVVSMYIDPVYTPTKKRKVDNKSLRFELV